MYLLNKKYTTNLGDRRNKISLWLISLSLLKNISVFIELKDITRN